MTPPTPPTPATMPATEMMTDAELAEIATRDRRATPGPMRAVYDSDEKEWLIATDDDESIIAEVYASHDFQAIGDDRGHALRNAEFYAHARIDVPRLLREVERQRAELAAARSALAACRAVIVKLQWEKPAMPQAWARCPLCGGRIDLGHVDGCSVAAALADAERAGAEGG